MKAILSNRQPASASPPAKGGNVKRRDDRRSDDRIVTVYRVAKLLDGGEELCLIRNISGGGVKAEVFSPKTVGDPLEVDFGDGRPQSARVVWTQEDCVGLSFDDPIDIAGTLAKTPRQSDRRARRLRLLLEVEAFLLVAQHKLACQLLDISQGGTKVRTSSVVEAGDRVRLEIEGLGRISGSIRWVRDATAGIGFTTPIPYRELAQWIATGPATSRAN